MARMSFFFLDWFRQQRKVEVANDPVSIHQWERAVRKIWIPAMLVAASLGVAAILPNAALAQVPNYGAPPSARPAFSPYLNLNRNDINPTISYYGIIRPQLAAGGSLQQLQTQQTALANQQQQQAYDLSNVLPITGHAAGFQTQNKYFLNKNSPIAGAGGAAPGGGAGQPKGIRK
jgi:hypothetical protein